MNIPQRGVSEGARRVQSPEAMWDSMLDEHALILKEFKTGPAHREIHEKSRRSQGQKETRQYDARDTKQRKLHDSLAIRFNPKTRQGKVMDGERQDCPMQERPLALKTM